MQTAHVTLASGDVIEFAHNGQRRTAEVMLVTEDGLVLLDLHDDQRWVHARVDQLEDLAVFSPDPVAA